VVLYRPELTGFRLVEPLVGRVQGLTGVVEELAKH
jgi:hypothetical protein